MCMNGDFQHINFLTTWTVINVISDMLSLIFPSCKSILRARTYLRTASTLQGLQILDPFTDMYTYTDLWLAHPLDIVNTF